MIDLRTSKQWLEQAALKRQALKDDPYRPVFHFLPPSSWMNDPNGLIHWQGQYHMFYQYNPHEAAWGAPHWGHAVSRDLVHWQDLPPALTPEMEPMDDGGCWSGCAVNHAGIPTIFYTGVKNGEQTTCMATGDQTLLHWQKHPTNPILNAPRLPGFHHQDYRDPFVWQEGTTWYMVISMTIDNRGQVLLYRSSDLSSWDYLHPLIPDECRATIEDIGDIWECPNFFRLGDKWVLIVSLWKNHRLLYPMVLIGDFVDSWFYPESVARLDWGEHCFYAPLTFEANGRRLMFGWLQEQRSREAQIHAGWSGAMSLARELSLHNGTLQQRFVAELQQLRQRHVQLGAGHIEEPVSLNLEVQVLELQVVLSQLAASHTILCFEHSATEATTLELDWHSQQLVLTTPDQRQFQADMTGLGNTISLHLYMDHSVIELIANQRLSLSARVYAEQITSSRIHLRSEGATQLIRFDAWALSAMDTAPLGNDAGRS